MTKRSGIFAAMVPALAIVLPFVGLLAAPAGAASTSSTAVTDNAGTIATGGTLVFTATVTGGDGGTPAGTVAWGGASACSSTTALTNGVATCSITSAQAATVYSVTASFTDTDGNYSDSGPSSGGPVSPGRATSSTSVTDNAGTINTGGTLVFTATVSGPGGTPEGTVAWSGSACPTVATSGGVATCSIPDAQGSTQYSETATFTDVDGNYNGSSGSDGPVSPVAAGQAPLAITSTSGTYGTAVDLTTTGGSGAGAVSYSATNGAATSGCSVSAGLLTSSTAGTCLVTASKAADGNFSATSSPQTPVTLALASSTTIVVDNSGSVVSGGTLVYIATVNAPSGVGTMPAGTVTWATTGAASCTTTAALTSGVAGCSITNAQAGTTYSATATYAPNDNRFTPSSGSDTTAVVSHAPLPAAPTITNLPSSGTFNGGFTAALNGAYGSLNGIGTPSVTSNSPTVCSSNGLAVSYVGVGTCSLSAQVAQGANYLGGSGTAQTFTIGRANPTTPTITNVPSPANEFFGFTPNVGTTGDGTTTVTSSTPKVCSVDSNGLTVTFVGFGTCTLTPSVAQGANYFGATGSPQSFAVQEASHGYWLVGSDGGIFSFGTAAFHGSMGATPLQRPVVAITPTLTGNGYWLVASDGGIFSFGDSTYYGSLPALGFHPHGSGQPQSLNAPIVGMVPTFTGRGYFMVASDGGVFAFGDAKFKGSCPGIGGCAGAAVSVMPDRTGNGYWLVTSLGDVYSFGDAAYYGGPTPSSVPVVDAVATPDGHGYWLLFANGVVDNFGDATNFSAPVGYVNGFNPATAIFPTADGQGYWVASGRGDVFSYGDSPYLGSEAAAGLNGEIIAAFGF